MMQADRKALDRIAKERFGVDRWDETLRDQLVKPLYIRPGSIGHLRWLATSSSPICVKQVLIYELPATPMTIEVYLQLHWWCWLLLGFLHMRALHRFRRALMRDGVAGIRYDVRIF